MLEMVIKSVIFLVLLALGGYFFVIFRKKNWFFSNSGVPLDDKDTLQVTQRISVGGRGFLAVVRCGCQRFLVGVTPSGISRIGELTPVEEKIMPQNNSSEISS